MMGIRRAPAGVPCLLAAAALATAAWAGAIATVASEAWAGTVAPADEAIYRAVIAERKILLPSVTFDGAAFVSLKAMAAALGGAIQKGKRPGDVTLNVSGHSFAFSAEDLALVSLDAGAASLSRGARPAGDDLYVPADFISRVVSPALEAGVPARDDKLGVTLVGDEGSLRVVLECSRPVSYEMKELADELVLKIDDPSLVVPYRSRSVGSPLLRSILFEGPAEPREGGAGGGGAGAAGPGRAGLTVHIGKGDSFARATAFDLRNPFRIIVELEGKKGASAGAMMTRSMSSADGSRGLRVVVLDPGHGGEQKGAEGSGGLLEKDVTLGIAQRLQMLLGQQGLSAVLTRSSDADVPLVGRTAIANREKADLFVSIHVNASPRREARGAETYYLAYQSADQEASDLAAAENASTVPVMARVAPLVAPAVVGSGAEMVLWDLAQAEHLRESSELAQIVQRELNGELGVQDRGVKQAPFRVLMGATMPAILVEVGFLSNPSEESSLQTEEYRERIAGALSRALMAFKQGFDRRQGAALR